MLVDLTWYNIFGLGRIDLLYMRLQSKYGDVPLPWACKTYCCRKNQTLKLLKQKYIAGVGILGVADTVVIHWSSAVWAIAPLGVRAGEEGVAILEENTMGGCFNEQWHHMARVHASHWHQVSSYFLFACKATGTFPPENTLHLITDYNRSQHYVGQSSLLQQLVRWTKKCLDYSITFSWQTEWLPDWLKSVLSLWCMCWTHENGQRYWCWY